MFGSSKRPVFKPSVYETSRRRRRMPRWLMLLLLGVVLGAGGLLFVQTSYGPQRLTVLESQQLTNEVNSGNLERQRLQARLEESTHAIQTLKAQNEKLASELAAAQTAVAPLQQELALFADAMPPDPRGGNIGVSSASFTREGDQLRYHVLLLREEHGGPEFKGQMIFAVEGRYPNGRTATIELDPLAVSFDRYQHLTGSLPMPDGLSARRVTVRVLDAENNRQQAMRILIVRG
ncbi:DUF6776 family protein [Orrella sp. JC864]|uniref:DUF6776 family protein n=1 Tax=Orrella sp. JC864 TaxID=3120298 RepID=UPI0012BBFF88